MKRLSLLILALALAASLVACGTDVPDNIDNTDTSDTSANYTSDTAQKDEFSTYTAELDNGISVEVGGDADALIATLGEPLDYMEAPSCIHEGFDKVYTFDGYSISTAPDANGAQYISELSLLSDAVGFNSGLMIGGSGADVEVIFGTDYTEEFGIRTYKLGDVSVSVVLDADIVTGITISVVK